MTLLGLLLVLTAVGVPHLVDWDRVPSEIAVVCWVSALALRALAATFVVVFVGLFLPATDVFRAVTQWCWHAVVPLVAAHLGLSGHGVGEAAVIVPVAVIAVSLVSVLWAIWSAARAVRRLVRSCGLGPGPAGSLMIGGSDVVVAAAGLSRPRVVISAGALAAFDNAELAASLDHERGHIVRRHRYLLVFGEICRAIARLVPGSRAAARQLAFHLERNADEYAVSRRHDPLALASAICKAALPAPAASSSLVPLAGEGTVARLRILVELERAAQPHRPFGPEWAGRLAAVAMVVLTVSLAAELPSAASAGLQLASTPSGSVCPG